MKLRLLSPHIISDQLFEAGSILDPPPPGYKATPLMEGLDEEGIEAVKEAQLLTWGRYPWPYGLYPPSGEPLDSTPIPRPLDNNQPVEHFSGRKEYIS